jgi:Mce-associated membrane protein
VTPSNNLSDAVDADVDVDATVTERSDSIASDGGAESRAPVESAGRWARLTGFIVLPLIAMLLAGGVGYLKYRESTARAAQLAATTSVQTARDGAVAMLSYTPDTADKDLTAARDRMTGTFRDSYGALIHDVVIPGAKQQRVSAVATVPAAASISADADHAVVLVYVNQAITIGDSAPTQTNSVVQVSLDRVADRWLISNFEPK